MSLSEGQILDGKYVIVRRLAEGGMSTVYLGKNQRIGKDVAVKVLHPLVARDPDVRQRFEREARIVSRIRSLHVADVFDFGELETGEPFMVMEYLEGESLAKRIERERAIPGPILATIVLQILDALAAAHAAGVIHRDLKPENVIVTTRGKDGRDTIVKIVDFGISKIAESAEANKMKLTAAGSVLGTPLYMSPEQARGSTDLIDHRSDLYSLGVIMYEATAGAPPLTGENVNDLLFRIVLEEPVLLAEKVPGVDPALAAIVTKAMAKDVEDRYQSADEMREAVEAWALRMKSAVASLESEAPSSTLSVKTAVPRISSTLIVDPAPSLVPPMVLTLSFNPRRQAPAARPSERAQEASARSSFRRAWRLALMVPLFGLMLFSAPAAQHVAARGPAFQAAAAARELSRDVDSILPPRLATAHAATPQPASVVAPPPVAPPAVSEHPRPGLLPPRARPHRYRRPIDSRTDRKGQPTAFDAGVLASTSSGGAPVRTATK